MVWDNNCSIVLHSASDGIFYNNDIVTGSVILEIKKNFSVGQIDFKVKGTYKATWSRPSPTVPHIKIFSEKRKILSIVIDVFDDLKGTVLKPGIFTRQFHFFLPPDLPPSYKDSVAEVLYRIKIKIKNNFVPSKKIICPVSVGNQVNLNHLDEYKIPLVYEMTKTIGKSGLFSVILRTYKGFTSNQLVPFEAIINNEQKVNVKNMKLYLIQKREYNIVAGSYNTEKVICKSVNKDIPNIVKQNCYFHMEIPHVLPSTINFVDPMIAITYYLMIKVNLWFHLPLKIEIPVTLTTIPIDYSSNIL